MLTIIIQNNLVSCSNQEEDELIDEWQPEPLVPEQPDYPPDILDSKVVSG